MCRVRKTNNGVKVLKQHTNNFTESRVELTRMTVKDGTIVYAVLAKHKKPVFAGHIWKRHNIRKFHTLGEAWKLYKQAVA